MKNVLLLALAGLGLSVASVTVLAQTCALPTTIASGGTFAGDTCAGGAANESGVTAVCGGGQFTDKAAIFTWTKASAASAHSGTITITPTGAPANYDVGVGVVRTTCGSSGVCVGLTDGFQDGTSGEAVDLSAAGFGPAGTYYMFVSSFGDGSTGGTCGTFTGTVGTLPVKLQSFSIH